MNTRRFGGRNWMIPRSTTTRYGIISTSREAPIASYICSQDASRLLCDTMRMASLTKALITGARARRPPQCAGRFSAHRSCLKAKRHSHQKTTVMWYLLRRRMILFTWTPPIKGFAAIETRDISPVSSSANSLRFLSISIPGGLDTSSAMMAERGRRFTDASCRKT